MIQNKINTYTQSVKIDMYEILQRIKNEALEYIGFNYGYDEQIVARLWNDGDITYDFYDGNCHPINVDDYIDIAESSTFYSINNTISDDLSLMEHNYLPAEYLDYLETENNTELIEKFEELDDVDFKIEFVKEHSLDWYNEWIEDAKQSIIDVYDFAQDLKEKYGEDFDRELREFEERHNLSIEFI